LVALLLSLLSVLSAFSYSRPRTRVDEDSNCSDSSDSTIICLKLIVQR
jgi:hypothetical protein